MLFVVFRTNISRWNTSKKETGVKVPTTQGLVLSRVSALRQRGAFTNIPFQRWETLSGDDWLRSGFGKTLLKTDKEPQCTLENMPLQDKE